MVTTNERQRRQHQRERRPGKQPSRTLQAKNDVNDDVKGNEFNERGEAIDFTSAGSNVCAGSKDEASEPLDVNDPADRPALHAVETHRSDGDPREAHHRFQQLQQRGTRQPGRCESRRNDVKFIGGPPGSERRKSPPGDLGEPCGATQRMKSATPENNGQTGLSCAQVSKVSDGATRATPIMVTPTED